MSEYSANTSRSVAPRGLKPNSRLLAGMLTGLGLLVTSLSTQAQTYSGNFGDAGNTALVGSDLGAASFTDADAIADNVALYTLVVPVTETVSLVSTGYAAGGADPYFTLFQGSGSSATFFDSNYAQAFSTGGDFDYSNTLTAGIYEVALGVFANESFAENAGSGTLGDGFVQLGEAASLGNGRYSVTVTLGKGGGGGVTPPVPEPSTFALTALALGGLALRRLGRRAHVPTGGRAVAAAG